MVLKRINSLFNPDLYHGWGRRRKFFEGWYFKIVNGTEDRVYAIIPGISMDSDGKRHSFIQVLDGINLTSVYHTFSFKDFRADGSEFVIRIGNNLFSGNRIVLDLEDFRGNLYFTDNVPWPSRWYSPGVMGPYSFVPFMECNHGILSMDHALEGELTVNNETIAFDGGRGYTEKDWGRSFPSAYVWMQSNHFQESDISFKASVAEIPWLRGSFTGFISGLWYRGNIIEFTTYNGSRLKRLEINPTDLFLVLENKRFTMEVSCKRTSATRLASPVSGNMSGHIHESMRSDLTIRLYERAGGGLILDAAGRNLALEVAGEVSRIVTKG